MLADGDVESREAMKFHVKTLSRGENGIELGKYKDDITRLYYEMFSDSYGNTSEAVESVEYSAKNEWEAIMLPFDGDQMVGFSTISRLKDDNMDLALAYISPQYRRQGIYSKLIQERVDFARSKGANSVSMEPIYTNVAQGSLEKYGFKKYLDPDAPGEVRYVKQLK